MKQIETKMNTAKHFEIKKTWLLLQKTKGLILVGIVRVVNPGVMDLVHMV